jgi:peptidase M23-like protein
MRRIVILLPVLLAFQVGVQPALAWTWPVDGPVLQPFILGDDPYAAGQHRGIDIGAPTGTTVRAPASGTVSFAGTVPGGGRTVTIRTPNGYSVTLVHLGTIGATRGAEVGEGGSVGTVGPSGEAELLEPYVHLGIRLTADPNGYLDPLGFLPTHATPAPEPAPAPAAAPAPVAEGTPPPAESGPPPDLGAPLLPAPAAQPAAVGTAHPRAHPLHRTGFLHAPVDRPVFAAASPRAAGPPHHAATKTPVRSDRELLPARTGLRSFEPAGARASHQARQAKGKGSDVPTPWGLIGAFLAAAAAAGLGLGRQIRNAGAADSAAAELLERGSPPAEDARCLRLREEDRLVLDGDLERILLSQAEALPDLDRDDDPAELVDVPDDPRPRHSPRGAGRRLQCVSRPHRVGPWSSSVRLST